MICPFIVATFYCHHRSCHGKDRLAPGDVFNWRHLGANAGRQGTRRVQRTAAAAAESGRWYNNLAKYLFAPLLHTLANFPIGKQTVVTVCVRMKTLRILSLSLSLFPIASISSISFRRSSSSSTSADGRQKWAQRSARLPALLLISI